MISRTTRIIDKKDDYKSNYLFGWLFSDRRKREKANRELSIALDRYNDFINALIKERDEMIAQIEEMKEQVNRDSLRLKPVQTELEDKSEDLFKFKQETSSRSFDIISTVEYQFHTYPFYAGLLRTIQLIDDNIQELSEHHERVKLVFQETVKIMKETERHVSLALSDSRVAEKMSPS